MDSSKLDFNNNLTRSKSLNSLEILDNVSNGLRIFHERFNWIKDSPSPDSDGAKDSTVKIQSVTTIQGKIEELNDLLMEQQMFLVDLKKDLKEFVCSAGNDAAGSPAVKEVGESTCKDILPSTTINKDNEQGKKLLDAIELKNAQILERDIKDALRSFLQSDNFSSSYLPMLECSHRRLLNSVTKTLETTFKDLEENSAIFSHTVDKTTKSLRWALKRHQNLLKEADHIRNLLKNLQRSLQEVLQKEFKGWQENDFNILFTKNVKDQVVEGFPPAPATPSYAPVSPPQPADPEISILEQLMKSVEINKQIKQGNVNSSFEKALSSADLSLVMAACKAADPAKVFSAPCKLHQSVLLSLIQQLSTDMVHDNQLKCRYLEEAIINLNTRDPIIRKWLPTVVTEVQKNLKKFLKSYPSHTASRRVTLIIMATNYLLKLL